jgi:hypothetical protein
MKIDPYIRQIVNRCHVSQSNLSVIKYVISRLKNKYKTWKALNRETRRKAMQQTIEAHKQNKNQYYKVMSGNFS